MRIQKQSGKKRAGFLSVLLTFCIVTCITVLIISLFLLFRPFTMEDVIRSADAARACISQQLASFADAVRSRGDASPADAAASDTESAAEEAPYIEFTGEQGDVSSLQAEYSDPGDQVYLYMLDTSCGPMLYYHQGDIRWGDFLYGGYDPMSAYGCGPTAAAMVINSFSEASVDPTDIAAWASENGYYALHSGSYHSLIPDAMEAYGLQVESVTDRSSEHVSELLSSGYILVALMGRGTLTQNGHFVLFTKLLESGNISIADPVNYEHCTMEWDLAQLLSELKKSYDSGGPLWAVRP